MIYLPTERFRRRFNLLTWPLPKQLLPWLIGQRGLGIYVLPQNQVDAFSVIYDRLGVRTVRFVGDTRLVMETAHYWPARKIIVMPYNSFFNQRENVLLHEIGHAVDFLFAPDGHTLSCRPKVIKLLDEKKPLNQYCKNKFEASGLLLEQFATAFQAFFVEPQKDREEANIDQLEPELIEFFNHYIVEPFNGTEKKR